VISLDCVLLSGPVHPAALPRNSGGAPFFREGAHFTASAQHCKTSYATADVNTKSCNLVFDSSSGCTSQAMPEGPRALGGQPAAPALFLRSTIYNYISLFYQNAAHNTHKEITKYTVKKIAFSAFTLLVGHREEHLACKNLVMGCWCGYLSGTKCRLFAYGPADVTAVPKPQHLLPHLNPYWFYLSSSWKRGC